MDSFSNIFFSNLEMQMNVFTILVSLIAVVYWVRLFNRVSFSKEEESGWVWIFASVLMVLLLNISSIILVYSNTTLTLGVANKFNLDVKTLGFVGTLSRTLIAISTTIGAYLIYASMGKNTNVKYKFILTEPFSKDKKEIEGKYSLESGSSYFVSEGSSDKKKALKLFVDHVKHGIPGLCITRIFPEKIREEYGLKKTTIIWLTREKKDDVRIDPTSLIQLSRTIKEYISETQESIILLDGIEYLVTQNSFKEVLRMIQSINDRVVQSKSMMIVTYDPEALEEQQLHLLSRELKQYELWE